jgi:hypothetical protein
MYGRSIFSDLKLPTLWLFWNRPQPPLFSIFHSFCPSLFPSYLPSCWAEFFAAGFVDWEAGWCAAARHLIPVVPLLAIPSLAAVVRIGRSVWGSVAVVLLVAVSGIHALLSTAVTPFFPPQFPTPLAQIVIPSFIDGAAAQNFVSNFTGIAAQPVISIMGVAVVMTLGWSMIRLVRDRTWWNHLVFAATISITLAGLAWQGSHPTAEEEFMRSQMLRRIGYPSIAEGIESGITFPSVGRESDEEQ